MTAEDLVMQGVSEALNGLALAVKEALSGINANTLGLGNVQNFGIASNEDAWGATSDTVYMTPAKTKVYVDRRLSTSSASILNFGEWGADIAVNTATLQAALDSDIETIFFPAGTFDVGNHTWSKNKALVGEGMTRTILRWPTQNRPSGGNMFTATGDVNYLYVSNMSFYGNRQFQTTPSQQGQDLTAFHMRAGNCRNVTFDKVHFRDFGDSSNVGGAAVFIGSLTGTNKIIENVCFQGCRFQNISNVGGVYINGAAPYTSTMRDIRFYDNTFIVSVPSRQNTIYILGPSLTTLCDDVDIVGNQWRVSAAMDCGVELNMVQGFSVDENRFYCYDNASVTGVLLRENVQHGRVAGNQFLNMGNGNTSGTAGVAIVQHTASGSQLNVIINGNVFYGWGRGSTQPAVNIGAGSANVTISDNFFMGVSLTSRSNCAIGVASSARVRIVDNYFQWYNYVLNFSTISALVFEDNTLYNSGDGAVCAITDYSPNTDVTYFIVRNNLVLSPVSGTPSLVSLTCLANTGNRLENNILPSSMRASNPSYDAKWSAIVLPAASGTLLAGNIYAFDQGALSIANNAGYTIGNPLDGTVVCALGDQVIVSANTDLKGCLVSGYVSAANQVRIRVQNTTGAAVDVAAARWRVTVIKASAMIS